MKTRKPARIGLGLAIIAFGMLTLFLSTSVLLDLFGIRERESPYVPAVVVANLIASLLYMPAGHPRTHEPLPASPLLLAMGRAEQQPEVSTPTMPPPTTTRQRPQRIAPRPRPTTPYLP
ncbi:MAG: hypothetical protein IPM68_15345 [Flavobacteriales bacterium]|nr:hypothetical protein [Flavobacteriales bacterium]